MTTRDQLESFQSFASDQLDRGEKDYTLDELYSLWRARNPSREEIADSVAALNAAYQELMSGDPGVPARSALRTDFEQRGWTWSE